MLVLITLHVPEPYNRTDFTLGLKILVLLWRKSALELHTYRRVLKACLGLLTLLLVPSSAPSFFADNAAEVSVCLFDVLSSELERCVQLVVDFHEFCLSGVNFEHCFLRLI